MQTFSHFVDHYRAKYFPALVSQFASSVVNASETYQCASTVLGPRLDASIGTGELSPIVTDRQLGKIANLPLLLSGKWREDSSLYQVKNWKGGHEILGDHSRSP